MILDKIEHSAAYESLGERFALAMKYLANTDFSQLPDGRQDILGEQVFAIVQRYDSRPFDQCKWEAHRRYADVQYIAAGVEKIGAAYTEDMAVTQEYDDEKDVVFLEGSGRFITLTSGDFMILLPHDAHMPGVEAEGASAVTKVVVKILYP